MLTLVCSVMITCATCRAAPQEPDPGAELAASLELDKARRNFEKGRMKAAWESLMILRHSHRQTRVLATAKEEVARMRLLAGIEVVGAAASFEGIVEPKGSGKHARLRITYDMTDPNSAKDFETVQHLEDLYPIQVQGGTLRGTGGWCHRAVFRGDISMEIEGVAPSGRDVGIVCIDPDAKKTRFAIGVFGNTFFGVKYDETRTISSGHILLFAGRGAESLDTVSPSQLLAQSEKAPLNKNQSLRGLFEWKGRSLQLQLPPTRLRLRAQLSGRTQEIRRKRIGMHVRRSRFQPRRVIIEGILDPKWAEQEISRIHSSLKK